MFEPGQHARGPLGEHIVVVGASAERLGFQRKAVLRAAAARWGRSEVVGEHRRRAGRQARLVPVGEPRAAFGATAHRKLAEVLGPGLVTLSEDALEDQGSARGGGVIHASSGEGGEGLRRLIVGLKPWHTDDRDPAFGGPCQVEGVVPDAQGPGRVEGATLVGQGPAEFGPARQAAVRVLDEDDVDDSAGPLRVVACRGVRNHLDAPDLAGRDLPEVPRQERALQGNGPSVDVNRHVPVAPKGDIPVHVHVDGRERLERLQRVPARRDGLILDVIDRPVADLLDLGAVADHLGASQRLRRRGEPQAPEADWLDADEGVAPNGVVAQEAHAHAVPASGQAVELECPRGVGRDAGHEGRVGRAVERDAGRRQCAVRRYVHDRPADHSRPLPLRPTGRAERAQNSKKHGSTWPDNHLDALKEGRMRLG